MLRKQNPKFEHMNLSRLRHIDLNAVNTVERIQIKKRITELRDKNLERNKVIHVFVSILAVLSALAAIASFVFG